MDRTEQPHLVRPAAEGRTSRDLSTPAGMARVGVEELRLPAGRRATISGAPRAEGFVYVLDGQGSAACAGVEQAMESGDCLGLAPGETLSVRNPHTKPLVLFVAFSEGGTGSVRLEP